MLNITKIRDFIVNEEGKILPRPVKWAQRGIEFLYLWYREVTRDLCLQRAATLTYTTLLAIFPLLAIISLFVPIFFGGVEKMEVFRRNSTAVGVFGIVGLMLSAMLLFSNVEKAFNEIWQARRHRRIVSIFSRFTTILVCVPLLIGASIILTAEMTRRLFIVGRLMSLIIPYFITCMAMTLAFFILPNTRVKFTYALIGGVCAGVFWEIAKVGLGYYVLNPHLTILGKSLGTIPIFLIWTYFTWLIVLLGCELAFLLQNYARLRVEAFRKKSCTIMDSRLVFMVFMVIADNFQRGNGGADFHRLLRRVSIRAVEMDHILRVLLRAGLVSETTEGLFIPTYPLDKTKPSEILAAGCRPAELLFKESKSDEAIIHTMEDLQEMLAHWAKEKSVKDIFSPV
ncbi:MAG: YihY family inner membrane protein [Candidatus Sumerlaeota bacterium]|nr:YihY family inner membrane protein [Candidatus Sumerlaeota bacterium]